MATALNCGTRCAKSILISFNMLFWVESDCYPRGPQLHRCNAAAVQSVKVLDLVTNPGWSALLLLNDISLLKLEHSITSDGKYIKAIRFPKISQQIESFYGVEVTMTGWGSAKRFDGKRPDLLHSVDLKVASNRYCKPRYLFLFGNRDGISDTNICASGWTWWKGACYLSGCALLVLGGWALLEPAKEQIFRLATTGLLRPDTIFLLAYALLSLGGTVLLIGIFGCCGALHEKRCVVVTYAIFLFLLVATELGVAFIALAYRSTVMTDLDVRLLKQLSNRYGNAGATHTSPEEVALSREFTVAMDYTQYRLQCCGVRGDEDYYNLNWSNQTNKHTRQIVPATCCLVNRQDSDQPWLSPQPLDDITCQKQDVETHRLQRYKVGCLRDVEAWLQRESNVLIACTISVAVLQLLGIFFSICLCRNIAEDV